MLSTNNVYNSPRLTTCIVLQLMYWFLPGKTAGLRQHSYTLLGVLFWFHSSTKLSPCGPLGKNARIFPAKPTSGTICTEDVSVERKNWHVVYPTSCKIIKRPSFWGPISECEYIRFRFRHWNLAGDRSRSFKIRPIEAVVVEIKKF